MSFPKIKDIENLSYEELNKEILISKKEIFDLKIQQVTRQSIKTHLFKYKKHRLSQLYTRKTQLLK